MAQSVGGVYIPLDLSTGKFNAQLTEADRKLTAFGRSANISLASIVGLGSITLGAGIISSAVKINKSLAETADLAREVGLSFDRIQAFKFAALSGGVSESGFTSGMEKMAKLIEESARQETTLGKLFEANNLSLNDRHGQLLNINDVMAKGADLVKNAGSGAAKVQVAEMLGLSREWVKTLENGGAAFLKTADGAREAGAVIDSNIIARAEIFEKQWVAATTRWQLATKAAAAELLPDMVKLADLAISIAASVGKWLSDTAIADKLDRGVALSVRELEYAIDQARKRGSPVDPSWIAELERLRAAQAAANKEAALSLTIRPTGPKTILPSKDKEESTRPQGFDAILVSGQNKIASLQAEAAAIGLTKGKAAELRVEQELLNAANRRGIELSPEQRAQITAIAQEYGALASRVEALNGPMVMAARSAMDMNKNFQNLAVSAVDHLADSIVDVASGTKTAAEAFRDMAKSILNDLSKMLIKAALWKMVSGFMGGGIGGGAPAIGVVGAAGPMAVPTFFKDGGLVTSIGRAGSVSAIKAMAEGGAVVGRGSGTSDSILAALSNGEFVVNAAATKKHRALLEAINSGFNFNSMLPALARGGPVGFSVPAMNDTPYIGKLGVQALGAGAGGGIEVHTHNYVGAQVEQRRSRSDGGERLDIIIKEAVSGIIRDDMARNGEIAGYIGNRFGLNSMRGGYAV
jgi:hypothetical protein